MNNSTSRPSSFWETPRPAWNSNLQEILRCTNIRNETHDVKSFIFSTPENNFFIFKPGQFITLELKIDGIRVNRCYTISSSPTRPHTISITVKRTASGLASNWLHDNLKKGDEIAILPPAGDFTFSDLPANKYLFLSGGSGITPLMSMTRAQYDLADDLDIIFIHSARTPDDIIFERELNLIALNQSNFQPFFICEQSGNRQNWTAPTGRISLSALKLMAPDFMEREIFVCGPAPYMKAIRDILDECGFDNNHYHEESFNFETLQKASPAINHDNISDNAPKTYFTVQLQKTQREITCGSDQYILEAARHAGVRLTSSCTQGVCGTCKARLISGKIDMRHKGGIRQREIDQGMMLLCCSKPLTDIVIDK